MKDMKQQKAKLESSAKGKDDRIAQLKVCTHVHYSGDFVLMYTQNLLRYTYIHVIITTYTVYNMVLFEVHFT